MPRGKSAIYCATLKQGLTRTVPGTVAAIERITGWKQGVDFFVGRKAPKEAQFDEPFVKPLNWEHCIHWFNGHVTHLLSQDIKFSANSLTLDAVLIDETRIIKKQKIDDILKNNILLTVDLKEAVRMKPIEEYVVSIPDFPEQGVIFRDVTSVLQDAEGLHLAIDKMQEKLDGIDFDVVAGPESRGFIFGVPIAYNMKKPFVPVRKKGKLPRETVSIEYELEYGTASIEMHKDSIKPGQRVVIIDDLIATGGTTEAIIKLIEGMGGEVARIIFLMELAGLKGRERLKDYDVDSVIIYPGK